MGSRKILTSPAVPKCRGSLDNVNDDLIVSDGDIFTSSMGIRYRVLGNLGSGTFGQVFECSVEEGAENVAIKVIKNQAAYYHQARVEIGILQLLNTQADPYGEHHIVRLKDFFMYLDHLCLVFELLNLNLYELIRRNKFRGLSLSLIRVFVTNILEALLVLKKSSIIHCDIKPENILLKDAKTGEVKLIDFGSACFKNRTAYTYIQSRFYRSPEVILGYGYTEAIDMWSLGCVAAELFLGLPLFPAASEFDLLERVTETLGEIPRNILINANNTSMYYKFDDDNSHSKPILLTHTEYEAIHLKKAVKGKQYFKHVKLKDIIHGYPFKPGISESEKKSQIEQRECFVDFLKKLLELDPRSRIDPMQALNHPYIIGSKLKDSDSNKNKDSMPLAGNMEMPHQCSSKGIPIAQHPASSIYQQTKIFNADEPSSSYVPAGSIHRIVNYGNSKSLSSGGTTGSLPMPMETPPSRSLGAKMHAPLCFEPYPDQNQRVVPIMEIPGKEPALQASFQPSSVRTFINYMSEFPKRQGRTDDKNSRSLDSDDIIDEENVRQTNGSDQSEWNLDEDPLWNDTDDANSPSKLSTGIEGLSI